MSDDAHDLGAEQSLLGSVLARSDVAGPVLLALPSTAWWSERHRTIAAVLADRLRAGKPVDVQFALVDLMSRRGFNQADTAPYLMTLAERAWSPTSADAYAERILHCAARRNLAAAATRVRQKLDESWAAGKDDAISEFTTELRDAIDDAEQAAAGVTAEEPSAPLGDLLAGQDTYDWLVPGLLERGERMIITGSEGLGKALALDTAIPTPKGWTTMGALSVGDEVFSSDGDPVRIVAATDVMLERPCFRVHFSDGAAIVADAQHLWLTETLKAREVAARQARRPATQPRGTDQRHKITHQPAVVTTQHMAETVLARGGHAVNHSVVTTLPLQYAAQELPIPPYVLGAWLGDGTSCRPEITCADPGILEHLALEGEPTRPVPHRGPYLHTWAGTRWGRRDATRMQVRLRALKVLNNKHIPGAYLHASVDQRLALLQGLMDTDGTVGVGSGNGRGEGAATCEFSVCSERLARDVLELLIGLGIKVTWREGAAVLEGRRVGTRYRLAFQTDLKVFRLSRKAERLQPLRTRRAKLRYVVAVEPVESVPVRCIQVARADGMFVAGRECIPTHNSYLASQLAVCLAAGLHPFTGAVLGQGQHALRVLIVDCENGLSQSRRRFRTILNRIPGADLARQNLRFELRPNGLNLLSSDAAWLERKVAANTPDLLVCGPLYRLHYANMNDELAARELVRVLDTLRTRHGCALLTEAHPGHSEDGSGDRRMRPAGSSLFLRWPEFGYGLRRAKGVEGEHPKLVDVVAWRGSREERNWPKQLAHGDFLPWEPANADYYDEAPR